MRLLLQNTIILLSYVLISFSSKAQHNCILIIADDVSPDYFGCFNTTTDTATMPNINTLAQQGLRFTNVWATPICSPTRAGIFTGRYSFRTGIGQVVTTNTSPQLDTSEMSIAKLLQQYAPVQYHTALAGKWHLHANIPQKRLYPNKMGFDYYSGNFSGALTNYYSYPIVVNGQVDTVQQYATTQTINDAISWLDTVNTTKPFFLWIAFNAPHSPYHLPPGNLCDTTGLTGTTAHINANKPKYFKAALQAMDTEIGRLKQYLQANNLWDSTNIIFIGDNGNAQDVAQNGNVLHCKSTIYNYGVQVPMIVHGPAVVNANRNCTELINTHDIFATIAELCSFTNWKNFIPTTNSIDSKSFLPYIKNKNGTIRDWIFTEQFTDTPTNADGKTIRNKQYQLLYFDNGNTEFYDLLNDSNQNNNLLNQSLNITEQTNFNFLCDTINTLLGNSVCTPLSIINYATKPIKIYPNPCRTSVHITLTESLMGSSFTLYNMLGKAVLKGYLSKEDNIVTLSDLPEGVYFLKINSNNYTFNLKVSVE